MWYDRITLTRRPMFLNQTNSQKIKITPKTLSSYVRLDSNYCFFPKNWFAYKCEMHVKQYLLWNHYFFLHVLSTNTSCKYNLIPRTFLRSLQMSLLNWSLFHYQFSYSSAHFSCFSLLIRRTLNCSVISFTPSVLYLPHFKKVHFLYFKSIFVYLSYYSSSISIIQCTRTIP